MFTNDDLVLANQLDAEIQQLTADIAVLNKLTAAWTTNYPDTTVLSKMVFHYQKTSGSTDLEQVEVAPSSDYIASLVTCLNEIKTQKQTLLTAKQAEFEALGSEPVEP